MVLVPQCAREIITMLKSCFNLILSITDEQSQGVELRFETSSGSLFIILYRFQLWGPFLHTMKEKKEGEV